MYSRIVMPVDLVHAGQLDRALRVAADLARHWGAELIYVGVTGEAPSELARTPQEYKRKLDAFAAEEAARHGHKSGARAFTSHDPAAELDTALLDAVRDAGADLVVMATHLPNMSDMLLPSHGGRLAAHTDISVFLVRGA